MLRSISGLFLTFSSAIQCTVTAAFLSPSTNIAARSWIGSSHNANEKNANAKNDAQIPSTSRRSSAPSSSVPIREEIRYIAGRRALLLHPPPPSLNDSGNNTNNHDHNNPASPPLVILGGMAQSIASWEFHLPSLSKHRSILIYEGLGQGPPPPSEVCSVDGTGEVTLSNYYDDVSLERQGRDFWNVVDEALFSDGSHYYEQQRERNRAMGGSNASNVVDVASFSFGGRVSMAAAVSNPKRIRRLHLTGVGAERDGLANVILASWKEILGSSTASEMMGECDPFDHASRCTSRLRSFAWSIILATYSEAFLASAGPERVRTWVDSVCRYNTEEGLRAILLQTHDDHGEESLWTPAAMARRIQSSGAIECCRVLVGSGDKMAHPTKARKLAEILHGGDIRKDGDDVYKVVEGCGHAVPMEAMRSWRNDVLDFLDK